MGAIEVRAEGLLIRDGRILLVNHEKRDASYWVLPGGHVEHGETLTQALRRELKEELNLDATVGALALVHDYIAPKRHVVNHAFRVEAEGEVRVKPDGPLQGARWFPLDDLGSIDLRPPIAEVLRRIAASPPDAQPRYLPGI